MPVRSKAQYRFMKAVEGRYIHPKGLTPEKAKEYTSDITKPRFKNLKEKLKKSK